MVESIDTLTLRQYFRIITSDPFSLVELGKGTDEARLKAWKKIIDEDAKSNKLGSHNRITELMEDRNRIYNRALRISACILTLSHKESESSVEILKSLSIEGTSKENLFAVAKDRYNGLIAKLNDLDKELGDRKPITMADCMREMVIIQTYIPSISLQSTLAEYRASQQLVREMNNKKPNNGKSDN